MGGGVVAPSMKVSASKKVAGYVRAEWQYRAARARLDAKLALLAPLQTVVARRQADEATRRATLTGTQRAEAERILSTYPSRRIYVNKCSFRTERIRRGKSLQVV